MTEVVCPKCGDKANAFFPMELITIHPDQIPSISERYAQHGMRVEINMDKMGRHMIWFFPDFFNKWPDSGWPATLTVCECDHCGFFGRHRFTSAPLAEQWGIDPLRLITHCPICGYGPMVETGTVDEVAYSFSICPGCSCEYGCDDTPDERERWLKRVQQHMSKDELEQRRSHMIMTWNVPQKPEWMYFRPVPIDADGGFKMK